MPDIILITALIIATGSVITIPIAMVRHLREDLTGKLEMGEKKFDRIVEKLDEINSGMQKCQIETSVIKTKVDILVEKK